ncbi:MAG: valine--tRNA ligase, partial [Chloroflexi bacterium]|nr:valine--tRNA ligase [Chloroflexota bacterium]
AEVFYPFGFDDNGLPTERFTENVRGIRARTAGRQAFIDACLELSAQVEEQFEGFWKRLGLSVDWRLRYSTIDPRSRRVSQAAFIDLVEKGLAYRQQSPTQWCPECGTGVAQADVEDRAGVATQFSTIPFTLDDQTVVPVATTRPELLAACVALMVHPDDPRYARYAGGYATPPLFELRVPIIADAHVDRDKGTGAVMCCTFGDVTDVEWWRIHHLPLRIAITPQGRMNDLAPGYTGLTIKQARRKILEDLAAAGKILEQRQIEHTVGVHERCGTDIEYLVAGQWFIRILDSKDKFLEAGRQIRWHPDYMRTRYESWIEGLNWDWNISRQRFYGVPFPVWLCGHCGHVILARREDLPIDPQETPPPIQRCPECDGTAFTGDQDVMDTWATSSVTPLICGTLLEPYGIAPGVFDRDLRPMTLRPNAHDIIRTWDFYTIVRSLYQAGKIPWTDVLISGHALDPTGKKLSKSKRTAAEDPTALLDESSADAVRYWATGVSVGSDTVISAEIIKKGQRLVTKLWNAARLVAPHLESYQPAGSSPTYLTVSDRWLLHKLNATIRRSTELFLAYDFRGAREEAEQFFWGDLCDNYLELVKFRLYGQADGVTSASRDACRYVLYHTLRTVLKLFAPFLPFITEEIYRTVFSASDGATTSSIHRALWPETVDSWADEEAAASGRHILEVVETVRRFKSEHRLSMGADLSELRITAPHASTLWLASAEVDIRSATRAQTVRFTPGDALEVDIVC